MLKGVKWGKFKVCHFFNIKSTKSFNSNSLVQGDEYDYVTRTSNNQGILQTTGFINAEKLNEPGCWSLGLLQKDFFYRRRCWYAGQFVRKIIPKFDVNESKELFFSAILNSLKPALKDVVVSHVNKTFLDSIIEVPVQNGNLDVSFIDKFMSFLKSTRLKNLSCLLKQSGYDNTELTEAENKVMATFEEIEWRDYTFEEIFDHIKQGRRLKKNDQIPGNIPFVMSGTTNCGVVKFISNPVAKFPENSITVDILGNVFYRDYEYGAGDDTGSYWNEKFKYSPNQMLFIATSMSKALIGKFSYGNKLRSSQSHSIKFKLPYKEGIDFKYIDIFISAIKKIILANIKDLK